MNPTPPLPPLVVSPPAAPAPSADWRHWLRRLFVCNPFFLVSAALLLFGLDKLSGDPGFLGGDEDRVEHDEQDVLHRIEKAVEHQEDRKQGNGDDDSETAIGSSLELELAAPYDVIFRRKINLGSSRVSSEPRTSRIVPEPVSASQS